MTLTKEKNQLDKSLIELERDGLIETRINNGITEYRITERGVSEIDYLLKEGLK